MECGHMMCHDHLYVVQWAVVTSYRELPDSSGRTISPKLLTHLNLGPSSAGEQAQGEGECSQLLVVVLSVNAWLTSGVVASPDTALLSSLFLTPGLSRGDDVSQMCLLLLVVTNCLCHQVQRAAIYLHTYMHFYIFCVCYLHFTGITFYENIHVCR